MYFPSHIAAMAVFSCLARGLAFPAASWMRAALDAPHIVQSKDSIASGFDYFFSQKLDHFDRSNLATFEQRYFVNTTYWKGAESGAPVFLCVGGEGPPLTYMVLVASDHCNDMVELAPKHGALLVALEHR